MSISIPAPLGAGGTLSSLDPILTKLFKDAFLNEQDQSSYFFKKFGRLKLEGDAERRKVSIGRNQSVGSYSELDTLGDPGNQTYTPATWNVTQYKAIAQVSGLVEAASRGKGAYFKAFVSESKGALEDLKTKINDDFMRETKVSSTDADSIPLILQDTGSYAGIDRGANAWWQPLLDDNNGDRNLAIALLQGISQTMANRPRSSVIDMILTDYAQFDNYGNLIHDQRRWGPNETLDAGIMTIDWQGVPIARVPGYPGNRMDFLRKKDWKILTLLDFKAEDQSPGNVDAKRMFYKTYLNLICTAPRRQAALTDLNTVPAE